MKFESFGKKNPLQEGLDAAKKAARVGVAGLALTGGPQLNVPIPAEVEALKQAAIERIVGTPLRPSIEPERIEPKRE